MRKTFRKESTYEYWARRWTSIPPDEAMENEHSYPLRHALNAVTSPLSKVLEAGCGTGRLLRYFHEKKFAIVGVDYVSDAVEKLKSVDPSLNVSVGDITQLSFPDGHFDTVLAFGLYHNLQGTSLLNALLETSRVLAHGGVLCASFRADNLCNRINDWLYERRTGGGRGVHFHKLNLTEDEFCFILESVGLSIESIEYVENMPLLYKFSIWRASSESTFDEHKDRKTGYRLNGAGRFIQNLLMQIFPKSFCNVYVVKARCNKENEVVSVV